MTAEQVCRGLGVLLRLWLEQVRGSSELANTAAVIQYQQKRNRAARQSRQRHGRGLPEETRRKKRRRRKRRPRRNRLRRGSVIDS